MRHCGWLFEKEMKISMYEYFDKVDFIARERCKDAAKNIGDSW